LSLNEKGRKVALKEIGAQLRKEFDFSKWLDVDRDKAREIRKGDSLEYGAAVMLLRTGPQQVYRSVELKPHVYSQFTEGELDLVFNWNGRLWVVDCKDKASGKETGIVEDSFAQTGRKPYFDSTPFRYS